MLRVMLVLTGSEDVTPEWSNAIENNLIVGKYDNSLVIVFPEDGNTSLVKDICSNRNMPVIRIPMNEEKYSHALAYRRRARWIIDMLIGAREHDASIHVLMFTDSINPSDYELRDFLGYCYALEIPVTQYLSNGGFIYDP